MEIMSSRPLWIILVSAIASVLILLSSRRRDVREAWTFLAAILKFLLVCSLYPWIRRGSVVVFEFFEILPGVPLSLRVDALGFTFALIASGLWILTSLYSVGYMRALEEKNQTRYFFAFAMSLSATATMGIAFAGDLLTFFIFYEWLVIATYPLVAHRETKEAMLGGRKYLVYSLSAGALFLLAIAWTYQATGTLAFQPGGFLNSITDPKTLTVLFVLFIYGCGVKAALFPVHAWLPTAMVAPTPVSALLHAVAVVTAGVFAILRIVGFVFGPETLRETGLWLPLAFVAGFTMIGASCMALAQDNLKRRLAYSTISQLAYIILGCALATSSGYLGAILHMGNHAIMKITLFFVAGIIYVKTHKENISEMRGIGRSMPWSMGVFAFAALGLSGLPPFSGFISKWFLCQGAVEAKHWISLAAYLFSALLNLAYFLPVVIIAFSKPTRQQNYPWMPWSLWLPSLISGVFIVLFGSIPFLIGAQINLARQAVASVFGG